MEYLYIWVFGNNIILGMQLKMSHYSVILWFIKFLWTVVLCRHVTIMNVGPSDQENLQQGIYCDFIISILWW